MALKSEALFTSMEPHLKEKGAEFVKKLGYVF